jgi:FimV-like protein
MEAAAMRVRFRKSHPYESLYAFIEPGHDEFPAEKDAAVITQKLNAMVAARALPLARDFQGASPMPARYSDVAHDVAKAEYNYADKDFESGLRRWIASLGSIRGARFFVLPEGRIRYEISAGTADSLRYHVGHWKTAWTDGRLSRFEPLEEFVTKSAMPWFRDVTGAVFGGTDSFPRQLEKGVPYWRAQLDGACGIDVYGTNGIAAGDIDGDGWDEVYVCQPGGLPNRLYKNRGGGVMEDITEHAGVGVLDNTSSALLVDFRNSGRQDLVVLTTDAPLLFLNQGDGTFRHKPDAFRFASPLQGTFTGMAAADYDRDGKVDLYLCTYVYFQSEDQYRYPVPYFDSTNGPPNFLFRNSLSADGTGFFEDVTAKVGLNENNNRYSFAPAWCDYDGDGWPDLCVVNDFGRNNLYRNEGGRFRDMAAAAGVEDVGPGMSAAWFDYDGDGRPDLYVSNMWSASGQRVVEDKAFPAAADERLRDAYRRHSKGNSLYRNRGDGAFESKEAAEGVAMGRWAWGADGVDFDNDGVPEIYVTCGMLTNSGQTDLMSFFWRQVVARSPAKSMAAPAYENGWNALNQLIRGDHSWNGREPNVVYARRGERFFDFSGVSGLDFAEDSRAFAVTDFDGDGNLDLLVKSRLGPQVRALQNDSAEGRRSIAFDLRGTRSNRDAIGARVDVEHAGRRVVQFLSAGSGFLSQHTKRMHFGLGESAAAEKVTVRWPSGAVQEYRNLRAGSCYRITEGSEEVTQEPFAARRPLADQSVNGVNDSRYAAAWLLEPVPLPDVHKGPGFVCFHAGQKPAMAGVPFEAVDLASAPADVAAWYTLFRMYLFDYRVEGEFPLLLLVDGRGFAHKVYPEVPDANVLREDLRLLGNPDRARLALPFAGKYYTPPHRNNFRLGAAFYWAGYPEQALVYLEEVIRAAPENGKAQLAVGHIHLEAERYTQARPHLEIAARLNPNSPDAWIQLGSLETAQEHYTAALGHFEKALSILPDSGFALVSAGRVSGKLGKTADAERYLRRAMEVDPKDAEASNQMGLLLSRSNRLEEARKYFQQAIAAQRDHTGAINNLGVLYMELREPREAIAALRYGIQVAPDEEMFYLNLARVYVAMGDRAKARDVLQQCLSRRPESAMAKKGLAELGVP